MDRTARHLWEESTEIVVVPEVACQPGLPKREQLSTSGRSQNPHGPLDDKRSSRKQPELVHVGAADSWKIQVLQEKQVKARCFRYDVR